LHFVQLIAYSLKSKKVELGGGGREAHIRLISINSEAWASK